MSFGRPAPYGKFYKGLADDTPVNHDLLWRARVTSEIALIKQTEANNNAAREAAAAAQLARASRAQAAMTKKNYTLEEELELKRVVDMEERKSRKENQRLQAERRARLEAQKKLFEQRQRKSAIEAKVRELEDAYFAGGVDALQQTLTKMGPTGVTQRTSARSGAAASAATARSVRSSASRRSGRSARSSRSRRSKA